MALDGVSFSLSNTPQITQSCRKGGSGRGKAAFAKLPCAALVELMLHNPLAACLARAGESEWKLALGLLDQLPARCLLLADRLYGCGAFVLPAWEKLRLLHSHFLMRVKENLRVVRVIKRFKDGSRLVEIKALEKGAAHAALVVREIKATLRRPGYRSVKLATVDQPAPSLAGSGRRMGQALRQPLGTGIVFPRIEKGIRRQRPAAQPDVGDGGAGSGDEDHR